MVVPEAHVRRIERLVQNLFICAPHASQVAALAALDAGDELEANLAVYRANRALMLEGLPQAGFGRIAPPDGAFYIYADVSAMTDDSRALAARILREAGVAVTPGLDFDPRRGGGTLRFSYAGSTADIAEGLRRLAGLGAAQRDRRRRSGVGQEPLSARDHQPRRFGPSSAALARAPPVLALGPARAPAVRAAALGAAAFAASGSAAGGLPPRLGATRRPWRRRPRPAPRSPACAPARAGAAAARRPRGPRRSPTTGSSPRSITSPNGERGSTGAASGRRVGASASAGVGAAAARAAPRLRPRLGAPRATPATSDGCSAAASLRHASRLRPARRSAVRADSAPRSVASVAALAAAAAAAALALAARPLARGARPRRRSPPPPRRPPPPRPRPRRGRRRSAGSGGLRDRDDPRRGLEALHPIVGADQRRVALDPHRQAEARLDHRDVLALLVQEVVGDLHRRDDQHLLGALRARPPPRSRAAAPAPSSRRSAPGRCRGSAGRPWWWPRSCPGAAAGATSRSRPKAEMRPTWMRARSILSLSLSFFSTAALLRRSSMSMKSMTIRPARSRSRIWRAGLLGGLQVGLERGVLDRGLARGAAGVDVDGDQRLGDVDDDVAAGLELHRRVEHRLEVALDLEAREQRQRRRRSASRSSRAKA